MSKKEYELVIPKSFLHDHIRQHATLSTSEKLVYTCLAVFQSRQSHCKYTNKHLAEVLCIDIRTLEKAITSLRKKNLIKKVSEGYDHYEEHAPWGWRVLYVYDYFH